MTICQDCDKRAGYNLPGLKAEYCKGHAQKDMVNVRREHCLEDGCDKQPNFNLIGLKAKYCKTHAKENMIDVRSKRCVENGCDKIPKFNIIGLKAKYCKTHAKENMIDVAHKRCVEDGCDKRAGYNLPGLKAEYCKDHVEMGMVDVKNRRCLEDGCEKIPKFNIIGEKQRLFCKAHAREGMVDVAHKRCVENGCEKIPSFNLIGLKAKYCNEHAKAEMVNVKHKRCKLCQMTIASKDGFCVPCFYHSFPEHVKTRQHKTRENTFMYALKKLYPDIILDKTVAGGCSRRRPDGLLDFYTHSVIVEIDEDQHASYDPLCEQAREFELYQDLGYRPIIFIRLNPDSYVRDGKKVSGCFGRDMKLKEREFGKRFEMLLEKIEESKAPPLVHLTNVKICFDH